MVSDFSSGCVNSLYLLDICRVSCNRVGLRSLRGASSFLLDFGLSESRSVTSRLIRRCFAAILLMLALFSGLFSKLFAFLIEFVVFCSQEESSFGTRLMYFVMTPASKLFFGFARFELNEWVCFYEL